MLFIPLQSLSHSHLFVNFRFNLYTFSSFLESITALQSKKLENCINRLTLTYNTDSKDDNDGIINMEEEEKAMLLSLW